MTKPVRIELNNSGAWKIIVRFDAADDGKSRAIMDAAADFARAADLKLRCVTDEALPEVLMRCEAPELDWVAKQ